MTAVVAVGNQKGGVGKTATTLHLASAARAAGHRVLVIDLDPQANATDVLADAARSAGPGSYGLLAEPKRGGGASLVEAVVASGWSGVDLVPASDALADVDADTSPAQPLRLRKSLNGGAGALDVYDVVLLDCPPSLGRLLIAGLVAASDLLIVTEPGAHAGRGVTRIEESASEVRDGFGQNTPRLVGIVVNRARRNSEHAFRESELRAAYGELVLPGAVPERIAVADAAGRGVPIHEAGGEGAQAVAAALDVLWADLAGRLQITTTVPTRSAS